MNYHQVCSQLSNDNTSQIWTVGSALCDIIIAVCMTYYVGFTHFLCLAFGRKSHLFRGSRWQLARYDHTIKQTRIILKKIIRLTIETESLTGAQFLGP